MRSNNFHLVLFVICSVLILLKRNLKLKTIKQNYDNNSHSFIHTFTHAAAAGGWFYLSKHA